MAAENSKKGFQKGHFQKQLWGGNQYSDTGGSGGWQGPGNKAKKGHPPSKKWLGSIQTAFQCFQQNLLKIVSCTYVSSTQAYYINTMNLLIACPRLGGRVAYFLTNWEVLTQDQWVLQTVAGYHLELTEAPTQARVPQQMKHSQESKSQIDSELQELLSKGAAVET